MTRAPTPPPLALRTGPAGYGTTALALRLVEAAATLPGPRGRGAGSPDVALLLLPTYAQATHLKRAALSRWGARALRDEVFVTFTSVGERFLPSFQVRGLPTGVERDQLMEEALRRAGVPAFARVGHRAGFRVRLLRLLKEVKQSGLPVEDACRHLGASLDELDSSGRERLAGVIEVFRAYEGLLAEARLEDHEDALRRLAERLRSSPPDALSCPELLVVDGFDDFTALELDILDGIASAVCAKGGHVVVTLAWDPTRPHLFEAAAGTRDALLARGYVEEPIPPDDDARDPALLRLGLELFRRGAPAAPAPAEEAVWTLTAGDDEDEAEAVARLARRLHEEGDRLRAWREMAVVVRRVEEAGTRIVGALRRLGVPARVHGAGSPLRFEPLAAAFRAPLRVLGQGTEAGDFDALELVGWLRWGAHAEGHEATLAAVDRLEVRWRGRGLPATWAEALAGLPEVLRPPAERLDACRVAAAARERADEVLAVHEEALEDLMPLPAAGGLDEDGRPLDREADHRRMRAAAARQRIAGILRDQRRALARLGGAPAASARDVAAEVLEAIDAAHVALPDRTLDVVNVIDAEQARYWEAPVVVVAGLAQGRFPLQPREDPLLRDAEREVIRARESRLRLALAGEREGRERRLFHAAVAAARRLLVLSRPGRNDAGDTVSPSLYVEEVGRVARPRVLPARGHGRPAPHLDECYTEADLIRRAAATLGGRDRGTSDERAVSTALLARLSPDLRRRAARWRRSLADALPADVVPARFPPSVEQVSPSRIRHALACPYRHFVRRVLGVPEDEVPFTGPVFDLRRVGTLAHDALRQALLEPDRTPEEVARDTLGRAAEKGAVLPPEGAARDLVRIDLIRFVRLMRLREQTTASPLVPLTDGLELGFRDVTLGRRAPFSLSGAIDRLDACAGEGVVVDYKLGKGGADRGFKGLGDGDDIQLALYAAAVEAGIEGMPELRVVGLEWVSAMRRYRRSVWSADYGEWAAARRERAQPQLLGDDTFRALLTDAVERSETIVAGVRGGDHHKQVEDPERCGACGVRTVCRPRLTLVPTGDPVTGEA